MLEALGFYILHYGRMRGHEIIIFIAQTPSTGQVNTPSVMEQQEERGETESRSQTPEFQWWFGTYMWSLVR